MPDAILAVFVLLPALITYFLKSNAAYCYLVLCGSFVLITLGNADLRELTGHLDIRLDSSTLNSILLIVPFLLTLLLSRRSFSGQFRTILHVITALCAGALLALIVVPLLGSSLAAGFNESWSWDYLQKFQTAIISAGFLLSLLLIWSGGHKHAKKHKK